MNKNKFLNSLEYKQLENCLNCFIKTNTRDCLLLLLALKTGARPSEILLIKKSDLNTFEKSVLITGLKNSNDREIPLAPKLFAELSRYSQTVQSDFIFPISYERFVQIFHQYRSTKHSLKALRHSFALELYKKCKDIRIVQQALGHKAISSTEQYQTYLYNQNQLRRALF